MKIIPTILLVTTTILTAYTTKAQTFKEPIAYQLKNGMNIIISENNRSPKAYSSFTLDVNAFEARKDGVVELLNAILNEHVGENSTISFKDNSGRLATATADLDQDLSYMANLIQNTILDQNSFDTAKAKLLASLKAQDYNYDQTVNENSIKALTLTDVAFFYNQISPEMTYLTIAGDVEVKNARAAAKKAFGNWTNMQQREIELTSIK